MSRHRVILDPKLLEAVDIRLRAGPPASKVLAHRRPDTIEIESTESPTAHEASTRI